MARGFFQVLKRKLINKKNDGTKQGASSNEMDINNGSTNLKDNNSNVPSKILTNKDLYISKEKKSQETAVEKENIGGHNKTRETNPSDKQISQALQEQKRKYKLPPYFPDELIRLAVINSAFREGVFQLDHLNLDEDLYKKAIFDLALKYYDARSKAIPLKKMK